MHKPHKTFLPRADWHLPPGLLLPWGTILKRRGSSRDGLGNQDEGAGVGSDGGGATGMSLGKGELLS